MRKQLQSIIRILDGTAADYGERERGQSLLEIAFFMPILIVMLIGLAEVGWYTNNYLIMLEVSRVAARFGTVLVENNSPITWDDGDVTYTEEVLGRDETFRVGSVEGTIPDEAWRVVVPGKATVPVADQASGDAKRLRDCANAEGFYEAIACLALDSMAPLEMEVDADLDGVPDAVQLNYNDIVISVFAVNMIPDPATLTGQARTNVESIGNLRPYLDPGQSPEFQGAPKPDGNDAAPQFMVTGRYPANANECPADDHRDPFDINGNGVLDDFETDNTRKDLLDEGVIEENKRGITALVDGGGLSDDGQRGFPYTGRWINAVGCYGSEFSIRDIEAIINLRGINLDTEQMNQLPTSQAFVLVEVMWNHQLLLDFPGFSPLFNLLGGEDGAYIQVWAAFPVPSAEFDMNLDQ